MGEKYEAMMPASRNGHRSFELVDDSYAMAFTYRLLSGQPVQVSETLVLSTLVEGEPIDLGASSYGVFFASDRAVAVLKQIAPSDFQVLPAVVRPSGEAFNVINIVKLLKSDDSLSFGNHLARSSKSSGEIYLSETLLREIDDARLVWSGTWEAIKEHESRARRSRRK